MESNFFEIKELINPVYLNMTMSFELNLNNTNSKFNTIPVQSGVINSPKLKLPTLELEKLVGQHKYGFVEKEVSTCYESLKELRNPHTSDVLVNLVGSSNFIPFEYGTELQTISVETDKQEQIKLEHRRQRNRLAAARCRKKKLKKIKELEEKVKSLKEENVELSLVVDRLKTQVEHLKEIVMAHVHAGCCIVLNSCI